MKTKPNQPLFLDSYEVKGQQKWCWNDLDRDASSQEFESEEEALEAWRNDKLQFSRLEDLD